MSQQLIQCDKGGQRDKLTVKGRNESEFGNTHALSPSRVCMDGDNQAYA